MFGSLRCLLWQSEHAVEYCQILSNTIKCYQSNTIECYQSNTIECYQSNTIEYYQMPECCVKVLVASVFRLPGRSGACDRMSSSGRLSSGAFSISSEMFSFFEETWYCSGTFFCHLVNISTNNVLLMIFSSKLFRDLALLFPPLSFFL